MSSTSTSAAASALAAEMDARIEIMSQELEMLKNDAEPAKKQADILAKGNQAEKRFFCPVFEQNGHFFNFEQHLFSILNVFCIS